VTARTFCPSGAVIVRPGATREPRPSPAGVRALRGRGAIASATGVSSRAASRHDKPRAFAEWGVALDGAGPYVRNAAAWFAAPDVVYQSYWNSDADFAGKLSDGRMPLAGAAYRDVFGRQR
jgi:hypothetical protein